MPDEFHNNDGGTSDKEAPAVVLPNPNAQALTGSAQGGLGTSSFVMPQPLLAPQAEATGDEAALVNQVERLLAEDGRFAAFAVGLVITTDGSAIRLSGSVPSEMQRQSLLAAVRALPDVSVVQDDLRVP